MERKTVIVADSSANLFQTDFADFVPVPLKILTDEKEYVDDQALDVALMLADLREYKGRSGTSCPSVGDWLQAFGDAEEVYAFPSPAIYPAVIMPPALPQRNIRRNTPTERYSSWIPCPPDPNWNY